MIAHEFKVTCKYSSNSRAYDGKLFLYMGKSEELWST